MSKKIWTVLIANRGEIACRIIRTCQTLQIKTIAVFSRADRNALHVQQADEAYEIGEAESAASYLNIASLLKVAAQSKADAIHPGYGFLSENADFAEAVRAAGLIFIGPSPEAMRKVGDKLRAKELATQAQVPMAPSLSCDPQDPTLTKKLKDFAIHAGFPIIVKAAGGGGGRGMRKVNSADELQDALVAAAREAEKFFGDKRVYCEKLITPARHVEVQIIADMLGNVRALFDRDCSMQRHHQKVIEEAPAPQLSEQTRRTMQEAAIRIAKAAGYSNAGTVEFLVDREGQPYFMEVNSRLQVEHPVTEAITGLDLVKTQIRIAEGLPLSDLLPKEIIPNGHAIECRICAESPEQGFVASTGRLSTFTIPTECSIPGVTVRVDTGFTAGSTITHYYDSLVAKLIVWAPHRETARLGAVEVLKNTRIQGVSTNQGFLSRLLQSSVFADCTHHITCAPSLIASTEEQNRLAAKAAVIAALSEIYENNQSYASPWQFLTGFRLCGTATFERNYIHQGRELVAKITSKAPNYFSYEVTLESKPLEIGDVIATPSASGNWQIMLEDYAYSLSAERKGPAILVMLGAEPVSLEEHTKAIRTQGATEGTQQKIVTSPLPGKIVDVKTQVGKSVTKGDTLLVIESMKMEHLIKAPHDGSIIKVHVAPAAIVQAGTALIEIGKE